MAAPPGWRLGDPTGTEVVQLKDGRWGVDLLDGTVGCFTDREHAEQFIAQQNAKWFGGRRPDAVVENTSTDDAALIIAKAADKAGTMSPPEFANYVLTQLLRGGWAVARSSRDERLRLEEICRDIVDLINTDPRQWEHYKPDYLGMLSDIEEMARKGYAPDGLRSRFK